ncbi:hypothetical protein K1719_030267 [Acacia pycnantha]|nr:hypothetical protein K1719_030267 [Acacia pycnantha]
MANLPQLAPEATRLQGKVALITGGARGIGASMARLFTRHGAKVIVADIRDELGQALCNDIGLEYASYVHCDVTKESDVETAVKTAISKHQNLDIMINNAVLIDEAKPSIIDNEVSEFERVLSVNLTGPFLGSKHAGKVMIPERKGSIINVGSVCSSVGGVTTHAYTSSKHGLVGLTKNVAAELGQYGIRVNCVSPYFVANELARDFFKLDDEGCSSVYSNLEGIYLREEDVAQAVLFLASDESKYISGHNLAIDGGFTTINPSFGLFSRSK